MFTHLSKAYSPTSRGLQYFLKKQDSANQEKYLGAKIHLSAVEKVIAS